MLTSKICKYSDFGESWYQSSEKALNLRGIFTWHSAAKKNFITRKFWEWCLIVQSLDERGKLHPLSHGLGFAVGTEPLSSYFASRGCRILATDLAPAESSAGWIERNEHAASLDQVFYKEYLDRAAFDNLVSYQNADMRTLYGIDGEYDFLWSSCALEHLGSLEAGIEFILHSSALLKPGGVAVHTTEYNVSSNVHTIEVGDNVIYRASDLTKLAGLLEQRGFYLCPLNFDSGDSQEDRDYDVQPYFESDRFHIKLDFLGYTCTSCVLIIERRPGPYERPVPPPNVQPPQTKFQRAMKSLLMKLTR